MHKLRSSLKRTNSGDDEPSLSDFARSLAQLELETDLKSDYLAGVLEKNKYNVEATKKAIKEKQKQNKIPPLAFKSIQNTLIGSFPSKRQTTRTCHMTQNTQSVQVHTRMFTRES